MSNALQAALKSYKAGNFRKTLIELAPLLRLPSPPVECLLIAAQCCARTEKLADAARYYARAATFKQGRDALLLRTLAARTAMQAGDMESALTSARLAARSGIFDAEAESTYRRLQRVMLCLPEIEAEQADFIERLQAEDPVFFGLEAPMEHIMWCDNEAFNSRVTFISGGEAFTPHSRAIRRGRPHSWNDRLRIGYLSNDYSDQHATMMLFQGVMFAHDREKYEIFHFCHTPADVVSADTGNRRHYPGLIEIGNLDDDAAEARIRACNLDILVDLKGHSKDTRTSLINRGLAPIQVSWLGFPGSGTGIDCDYFIGDAIVTPDSSKPFYHEKLCRLPETYQPNDNRFRALPPPASRASLGLPENAFVLASFNTVRKVTPQTARLWARVMQAIPDSILWMICEEGQPRRNFTAYMDSLGIDAARIVFAGRASHAAHMARLQAADIALDTFPCNGHTTTSDKLWAGLPVVTKKGRNFASRVSESLLHALGLPELVADDSDGYVALCRSLAEDCPRLAALREKIAANRFTHPLFDTERFTRHLQSAYDRMAQRGRAGLAPDHIDVPPLPPRDGSFQPADRN